MTRCACERDGNPILSPVAQQQRGDKGGKLFIKVSLECCTRQDTQAPRDQGCNRAAPGKGNTGDVGQAPGPNLPSHQEQGRGIQEYLLKREQEKDQGGRGGNSNCYQSARPTVAKTTMIVWYLSDGK